MKTPPPERLPPEDRKWVVDRVAENFPQWDRRDVLRELWEDCRDHFQSKEDDRKGSGSRSSWRRTFWNWIKNQNQYDFQRNFDRAGWHDARRSDAAQARRHRMRDRGAAEVVPINDAAAGALREIKGK